MERSNQRKSSINKFWNQKLNLFWGEMISKDKTSFYEKGQKFSLVEIVPVCRYLWKNPEELFRKLEISVSQTLFELVVHSNQILSSCPHESFYIILRFDC
jgi:hypothetical protein